MKKIIAGPWLGELGWELMRWQGIFRNIKNKSPNTEIVMAGRQGNEFLYEDYISDYITIPCDSYATDGWRVDGKEPTLPTEILDKYKGYLYMSPITCMRITKQQSFISYATPYEMSDSDPIVIHARCTVKGGSNTRNWPKEKWEELVSKFPREQFITIGTTDAALNISTCRDLRDEPLREVAAILSRAKLVIGPSSGPMHLASLCNARHLVWTDNEFQSSCNGTNRQRYEHYWNPLNAKAYVIDEYGWQPPVDVVTNKIKEVLHG